MSDTRLRHRKGTTFSRHIWKLKDLGHTYTITWKVMKKCATYNPVSDYCQICNEEKFFIMENPEECTLNKRNEIFATCRHKAALLLVKEKVD